MHTQTLGQFFTVSTHFPGKFQSGQMQKCDGEEALFWLAGYV
jgi:hypothetical protein